MCSRHAYLLMRQALSKGQVELLPDSSTFNFANCQKVLASEKCRVWFSYEPPSFRQAHCFMQGLLHFLDPCAPKSHLRPLPHLGPSDCCNSTGHLARSAPGLWPHKMLRVFVWLYVVGGPLHGGVGPRCNKWGLEGCLAALPGNRPFLTFFCLFRPFPEGSGGRATGKPRKK